MGLGQLKRQDYHSLIDIPASDVTQKLKFENVKLLWASNDMFTKHCKFLYDKWC